jgi:hypothetical protein
LHVTRNQLPLSALERRHQIMRRHADDFRAGTVLVERLRRKDFTGNVCKPKRFRIAVAKRRENVDVDESARQPDSGFQEGPAPRISDVVVITSK